MLAKKARFGRDRPKEIVSHSIRFRRTPSGSESRRKLPYAQGSGNKASQVTDDTSSEGKDDGVARATLVEEPILELGLDGPALGLLAGGHLVRDDARGELAGRDGTLERGLERGQEEGADVGVGHDRVRRRRQA
jgi:hypothetical protein